VPRGVDVPCLDQNQEWTFTPGTNFKVGDMVTGGDILGTTFENDLFSEHRIMMPPKMYGRIVEVMPSGNYTVDKPVAIID
jgi:V-type H+-transporting ATPase subunit A